MTVLDVINALKDTEYPIAYLAFKTPQEPPFICIQEPYTNNAFADGQVNAIVQHIQVDLYTRKKDDEVEDKVENALSSFAWNKEIEYEDGENVYRTIYELEVV